MEPIKEAETVGKDIRAVHPVQKFLLLDVLRDKESRLVIYWVLAVLVLGTLVYHWFEGWSYLDALYFCVISLATIGSTSPYVGLFGTVWGIMSSFTALGNVQQATLALVAPGIAEALFATAMGLFAAIPAVIFYNRYSAQIQSLANRYDNFVDEFVSVLMNNAEAGQKSESQQPDSQQAEV